MALKAFLLTHHGHAHGAAGPLEHRVGVQVALLRQPRELLEPGAEDAFHAHGSVALGGTLVTFPVKLRQIYARPEAFLEIVHFIPGTAEIDEALDNHVPGQYRRQHQHGHDRLHGKTGLQYQIDQAQLFFHSSPLMTPA